MPNTPNRRPGPRSPGPRPIAQVRLIGNRAATIASSRRRDVCSVGRRAGGVATPAIGSGVATADPSGQEPAIDTSTYAGAIDPNLSEAHSVAWAAIVDLMVPSAAIPIGCSARPDAAI